MRRREFIAGLGAGAAWPLAARAQQAAMPVVGFLSPVSAELDYKILAVPFLQGLKETGYVEGQNVAVTTATRSEALPDVPTVGEFVPGYEASSWYGVGVPKNTPAEIVDSSTGKSTLA